MVTRSPQSVALPTTAGAAEVHPPCFNFCHHRASKSVTDELRQALSELVLRSHELANVRVVKKEVQGTNITGSQQFDTVTESLAQFVQVCPSDDTLLIEENYVLEQKFVIYHNLKDELEKINNLIPDSKRGVDYAAFAKN
jgi:hypothetical protein